MNQHIKGTATVFTKKYNVIDLIYYETFSNMKSAKLRERKLKNWHKEWKWNLIKTINPELKTLNINLTDPEINSGL